MQIRNAIAAIVLALAAASCGGQYNVEGTSSVSVLDGSKLYLKALVKDDLKSIDSCEVVHGQFHFTGRLDSTRLAQLTMGDELAMPVVLEEGQIAIKIDPAKHTVAGTELNDKLYQFLEKHDQLAAGLADLQHRESQMLLDGVPEEEINAKLTAEASRISAEEDKLVTDFISDNFDNVLGPCVFMMVTSGFEYPILTPQLEFILSKATDTFKNDSYVKQYCEAANSIQARQQGLEPEPAAAPAAPADTTAVQK